eukprot:UN08315
MPNQSVYNVFLVSVYRLRWRSVAKCFLNWFRFLSSFAVLPGFSVPIRIGRASGGTIRAVPDTVKNSWGLPRFCLIFFASLGFKLLITASNVFGLVEKPKPITDSKIILTPKPT